MLFNPIYNFFDFSKILGSLILKIISLNLGYFYKPNFIGVQNYKMKLSEDKKNILTVIFLNHPSVIDAPVINFFNVINYIFVAAFVLMLPNVFLKLDGPA